MVVAKEHGIKPMELITQPPQSTICGQCSSAMVLGIHVSEVINVMGAPEYGTTDEEQAKFLRSRGVDSRMISWPDNRRNIDLSGRGIISITTRGYKWGHAMAFEDGRIFDPTGKVFENIKDMKRFYKSRGKTAKVFSVITALL